MLRKRALCVLVLLPIAVSTGCRSRQERKPDEQGGAVKDGFAVPPDGIPSRIDERPSGIPDGVGETAEGGGRPSLEKELLHDAGEGRIWTIGLSADTRRWYAVVDAEGDQGSRDYLVTEEGVGPFCDDIHGARLAGDTLAHWFTLDGRDTLSISRPGRPLESHAVRTSEVLVSADGSHVAFVGPHDGRDHFYYDGEPVVGCDFLKKSVVPRDGPHIGLVVSHDRREMAVVDGNVGPAYGEVDHLVFGGGGSCHAYVASDAGESFVVFDGRKLDSCESADVVVVAPDCSRVACRVSKRGPDGTPVEYVVEGDRKGAEYDSVHSLSFSGDGRHVAYIAKRDGRQFLVQDGKEANATYFLAMCPLFSFDGSHLAYGVFEGTYVGEGLATHPEGEWFLVRDGVEGRRYDDRTPRCSSDDDGTSVFSDDGEHLAWIFDFRAPGPGGLFGRQVLLDGEEGPRYLDVENPFFLRGTGVLVYRAQKSETTVTGLGTSTVKHLYAYVIGGVEGPFFHEVGDAVPAATGRSLRYVAVHGSQLFLVTATW